MGGPVEGLEFGGALQFELVDVLEYQVSHRRLPLGIELRRCGERFRPG